MPPCARPAEQGDERRRRPADLRARAARASRSLQACDDLMYASPPLSDYEEYASTCGGRVEEFSVPVCTELECPDPGRRPVQEPAPSARASWVPQPSCRSKGTAE